MNLRSKTALSISVGFAIILMLFSLVIAFYILKGAERIEQGQAATSAEGLQRLIMSATNDLLQKSADWSFWDDTYYFVQDRNQEYFESNLQPEALLNLDVDYILIFNSTGDIVTTYHADVEMLVETPFPETLLADIRSIPELFIHEDEYSKSGGLIISSGRPIILASTPITKSNGGDIGGTFMFAYDLDDEQVKDWSVTLSTNVSYHLLDSPELPQEARGNPPLERTITKTLSKDTLTTYVVIDGATAKPSIIFRTDLDRNVYREAKSTLKLTLLSILLIGLSFGALLLMLMDRLVLRKITRIIGEVNELSRDAIISKRISEQGDDEISDLASSINRMIASIQRYQTDSAKAAETMKSNLDYLEDTKAALMNMMEDFAEALENQKHLERIKTEFLSVTSHELRTPITPMRAQLQMVLGGFMGRLTAEQKKSLNIVLDNTTRLDHLIGDILDISKLQSGVMKFVTSKADLNEVVKSAVDTMRMKAEDRRIKLELMLSPSKPVLIDKERTIQVVINLLNNAIKFTDPGGKITVRVSSDNESAIVKISDTGIGISKEDAQRLFQPFEQVDSSRSRNYEGSGLGLAICRGIVQQHGGDIWVESEQGKGSTFIFNIPYKSDVKPGEADLELFQFNRKNIMKSFRSAAAKDSYVINEKYADEMLKSRLLTAKGGLAHGVSFKDLEAKGYVSRSNRHDEPKKKKGRK